ncbi:MAG: hypothetical protein LLG13_17960 [Bacteroidales bacterium]|nr:hypothetical protein [Bacteroidales bacterium]
MPGNFKKIIGVMGLSWFLTSVPGNAQLLQDAAALNLVKEDIDYIYNLQFSNARKLYTEIIQSYPEHPIVFLLRGMMTYRENYPMLYTNPSHVSFEEDMHECIRLSENSINPDYEAEYLLADFKKINFDK